MFPKNTEISSATNKKKQLTIEQYYHNFIDNSDDGIWCFESTVPIPVGKPENEIVQNIFQHAFLVECNQAFAEVHQFKNKNEIIGKTLNQILDQNSNQDITLVRNFIRNFFRLTNVEYHLPKENGHEKVFIINLFGIVRNNCLVQTWGVQRDITSQVLAQEKIKRSESRYRNIFDYAFDAIFIEDLDGNIHAVNKRATEMLGYSTEEFLNMNIRQIIPTRFKEQLPQLNNRIKRDEIVILRSQNRHKNGKMIDVEICIKLLNEEEHDFIQVFVRDISQRIQFQEEIHSLSAQIEQFSQISADIITITDIKELFQKISDAIVEISDFSRVLFYTFKDSPPYRNILGHVGISDKNISKILTAEAPKEIYLNLFKEGIRLGNQSCYIPHTMKHLVNQHTVDYGKRDYIQEDGWHREDNLLVAMKNKDGEIIGMISLDDSKSGQKPTDKTVKPIELFANHISQIIKLKQLEEEQRGIEERFQQSEKLRALGEMAGGVAHDFNNVLSAILGRAQLLKRDVTAPEILHGLEIIEKAAIDGASTIKRIQEFTRLRTDKKFDAISINDTIRDSIKYTRTRWKNDADEHGVKIDIQTNFDIEPMVEANSSEMREVFTNLILNSIEAMPKGGTITFTTTLSSNTVIINISDTGTGMKPDVVKRIFDPFFTTKGVKGTGLGLSVTYGIIIRHSGTIEVDSTVNKGTTVTIRLPLYVKNRPVKTDSSTRTNQNHEIKSAEILVVDDEEDPRELLKDILEMDGHKVYTACSGQNALEILNGKTDTRIILTDLGMPEMSGWELSRHIKSQIPDAVIVVVTGWGTQLDQKRLSECGIERIIAKPFQVEQISQVVAECIQITNKNNNK